MLEGRKMSEGVSRISVSVPPDLLRKFDEALKRLGYEEYKNL